MAIQNKMRKFVKKRLGLKRIKPIQNPCESVNIQKEVIFIAIPKTGSSSVRSQVRGERDYLVPHEHLNLQETRHLLTSFLIYKKLGNNWEFPSTDVPCFDEICSKSEEIWQNCFKFSVVRNPYARTVSLYFRNEGIKASNEMSFDEFVERIEFASDTCVHPSRHNTQADWLKDASGNIAVDKVYKLEDLHKNMDELSSLTKINMNNRYLNINKLSKSSSYRDLYNEWSKRKIENIFYEDIEKFKYTY
jgi:hypothetical protein